MSRKTNKTFMIFSAFCILFVVDAHAGSPLGFMTNFFPYNSFFMPAFCFVSGYFFKIEQINHYGKFVWYKIEKLLIPFFAWNIVYGILITVMKWKKIIYYGEPITFETLFIRPFLDCTMFQFNNPAWFVPALFLVVCLYGFLRRILKKAWNEYLVTVIFIVCGTLCVCFARKGLYANSYILVILKTFFLMQFYQLGYLFKIRIEKTYRKMRGVFFVLLLLLINMACICITGDQISFINLSSMSGFLTDYYFVPFLTSITGIFFWLKVSDVLVPILGNNRIVNYISDNTWTIMMHHIFFFNVYNMILMIMKKTILPNISFDYELFKSTAWYIFNPIYVSSFMYVLFGVIGPLSIKYTIEIIKKMKH